jgi:MoxR-like ATPase
MDTTTVENLSNIATEHLRIKSSGGTITSGSKDSTGIIANLLHTESLVPDPVANFTPPTYYGDLKLILASGIMHNILIVGETGIGKTLAVDQACAELGREMVRVNLTRQTDEDDLMGGLRMISGTTQFELGPVPIAMERGAVLLLDEVDLGGADLMCLQGVLEGRPVLIKKVGKVIRPAPGFCIVATANTKGSGDPTGKYQHTQIMNQAMRERFPILLEAEAPEERAERRTLTKELTLLGLTDEDELKEKVLRWVKWAIHLRTEYGTNNFAEHMNTRRLVFLARSYMIFKDELKALAYTLGLWEADAKQGAITIFTSMMPKDGEDSSAPVPEPPKEPEKTKEELLREWQLAVANSPSAGPIPPKPPGLD